MSIIREHTQATLSDAWRTINIDALEEDSSVNFDTATLHPSTADPAAALTEADVRQLTGQVRQLLRGGDAEGALRGCLESPAYGAVEAAREAALQTVIEVLQSIKASEMTPMLQRVYASPGGSECLDVLMKYLWVPLFLFLFLSPFLPALPGSHARSCPPNLRHRKLILVRAGQIQGHGGHVVGVCQQRAAYTDPRDAPADRV
jgi:actin related protein 2/3 complex subunit 5